MNKGSFRDMRATMRATTSQKVARSLIANALNRLGDIQHIGWPRLEASLQRELDDLRAMAREKGFSV